MTVEIVKYISDLDDSNPKGSDKIAEGDNHIRNIKYALGETFPNIDGAVLATQDEINLLQGLTESVPPALPEVPTEEGSILANASSKWSETVTMKVIGDKVYIPALAGIGNLSLYVDPNGEVIASALADDPAMQHDLNYHTDVVFDGAPERDDVLMHDGVEWKAKRIEGNAMTPITQPQTAGQFTMTRQGGVGWEASGGVRTLSVPNGMKFILTDVRSVSGGTGKADTLYIDGVHVYPSGDFYVYNGYDAPSLFQQSGPGAPNFVARQSVSFNCETQTILHGFFVEDK